MPSLSAGKVAFLGVTFITAASITYIHYGQRIEREVRCYWHTKNYAEYS